MYDAVIIGAGPAGLFTAYKLRKLNKDFKIAIIDKGKNIYDRHCPIRDKENVSCVNCSPCNIICGYGGAGAFSDCKLSLTPFGVGGNITDYIDDNKAVELINEVDKIFASFDNERDKRKVIGKAEDNINIAKIKEKCNANGIDFTEVPTKHLGTDGTLQVIKNLYTWLKNNNVEMIDNTKVTDVVDTTYDYFNVICKTKEKFMQWQTRNVIFAPGRSGNAWLKNMMKKLGVETTSNKVDIGVRVEVPAESIKYLTDNLYDMKLSYVESYTGDKIRTFCTNPNGYVSEEHYKGNLAVVNGHSFANKKSNRSNFALLVTLNNNNLNSDYINAIVETSNFLSEGKIIAQNVLNFIEPKTYKNGIICEDSTLKNVVIDDLNIILPKRVTDLIVRFLAKLSIISDSTLITEDTTLYGVEAKFYSDRIKVDNNFETSIKGIYAIGDGAGISRGITQASACGLVVAEHINNVFMK